MVLKVVPIILLAACDTDFKTGAKYVVCLDITSLNKEPDFYPALSRLDSIAALGFYFDFPSFECVFDTMTIESDEHHPIFLPSLL